MAKRVIVIASGDTEEMALPHLTAHLRQEGITVEVRIPADNRAIKAEVVYQIIQSTRYNVPQPDKYVVLVDLDGKTHDEILQPIRSRVGSAFGRQSAVEVLYAYAQWHLEAWFFADERHLREYLGGRALGNVDASQPDYIQNPKEHLKNLLPRRIYTARTSEAIARALDARTIAQRSPSFAGFLSAVRNGAGEGNRAGA